MIRVSRQGEDRQGRLVDEAVQRVVLGACPDVDEVAGEERRRERAMCLGQTPENVAGVRGFRALHTPVRATGTDFAGRVSEVKIGGVQKSDGQRLFFGS
ncbi:hypothetical protein [Streptomyces sp. NPDC001508]|uniref:hypothetical protein n=1 Tax=Streptomyces sp. NPDC001508 TaxID=3154656 RepID=UPI00333076FE